MKNHRYGYDKTKEISQVFRFPRTKVAIECETEAVPVGLRSCLCLLRNGHVSMLFPLTAGIKEYTLFMKDRLCRKRRRCHTAHQKCRSLLNCQKRWEVHWASQGKGKKEKNKGNVKTGTC